MSTIPRVSLPDWKKRPIRNEALPNARDEGFGFLTDAAEYTSVPLPRRFTSTAIRRSVESAPARRSCTVSRKRLGLLVRRRTYARTPSAFPILGVLKSASEAPYIPGDQGNDRPGERQLC